MQDEATDLRTISLGLEVRPSAAHPGGRCPGLRLRCRICHGPTRLRPVLGSLTMYCARCCAGWGVEHDPERCWGQL
ncbi:hypothetical protein GPJ59_19435 [Streptomyces bambusae]|uniref:Uncharacterized protein n=2 Tax=Streptomyces bambusae TaxID=1550616 RepID=A0ABS6Z9V4_9ACTN|nr:hypothetical protein [Streptomyces bambusae]